MFRGGPNMAEQKGGSTAGAVIDDLSHSKLMLRKLVDTWPRRAYVKKQELEPFFEDGKEDFLESLLPFRDMPQYQACSPELKSQVLSCGWLMYNAKTVQIETDIVNPICLSILQRELPGLHGSVCEQAVCETMVDESYHVHLVEQASRLTRHRRGLEHVAIPKFNLVGHMQRRQRGSSEPWQRRMVQFAAAVVSEIFISDYLHLLSESDDIQPFNRMTVAAHRHDELAHSPLFRSLAQIFSAELNDAERAVFADILPEPVLWFADRELDTWLTVLRQIGFPKADEMIRECRAGGAVDLEKLDYSGVISLAEEIGVMDAAADRDSFARHGLVA
jgi:alpha-N-dichloroacetyl-p-aminophenylserinol N-oxygenase